MQTSKIIKIENTKYRGKKHKPSAFYFKKLAQSLNVPQLSIEYTNFSYFSNTICSINCSGISSAVCAYLGTGVH